MDGEISEPMSDFASLTTPQQDDDFNIEGTLIIARELMASVKKEIKSEGLDRAIDTLQSFLDDATHAKQDCAKINYYLAKALLTRYGLYGWMEDLDMCFEITEIDLDVPVVSPGSNGEISDLQVMSGLIDACRNALNLDALNTVICVAKELLSSYLGSVVLTLRSSELRLVLASALLMKYLGDGERTGLDEAATIFQDIGQISGYIGCTSLEYLCLVSLAHIEWLLLIEHKEIEATFRFSMCWERAREIDAEGRRSWRSGTRIIADNSIDDAQLDEAIELLTSSLHHRDPPHPRRGASTTKLALAFWIRFEKQGVVGDLEQLIALGREAVALQPTPHPTHLPSLTLLALALSKRFHLKRVFQDLQESILHFREALALQPQSDPDRSMIVESLAAALLHCFRERGDFDRLEESVTLYREMLALQDVPHQDRSKSSSNLSAALFIRFKYKGAFQDLYECIVLGREVLDLQPPHHPGRSKSMTNLAAALCMRFEQKGSISDLEDCIVLYEEALNLCPQDHTICLDGLAVALHSRFEHKGEPKDLRRSIALHREALALRPAPHPDRSTSLNNIGNALCSRFERDGAFEDLQECIVHYQEAVDLRPTPHPGRSYSLIGLATGLWYRFNLSGAFQDLDECISLRREAIVVTPSSSSHRVGSLHSLADALLTHFDHKGGIGHLEECIALSQESLCLRPVLHLDRPLSLASLAKALLARFDHTGVLQDLDDSITLMREALGLSSESCTDYSLSLNNLSYALFLRFEAKSRYQDLEECIEMQQAALALQPVSDPNHSTLLNNLANALSARFNNKGAFQDLERCIVLYQEALDLQPMSHPKRFKSLQNLAGALCTRFKKKGEFQDLEKGIVLCQESLALQPAPHPNRPRSLCNLAQALLTWFEQKERYLDCNPALPPLLDGLFSPLCHRTNYHMHQDDIAVEISLHCYEEAARYETGSPTVRLQAAKIWAACAQKYRPTLALDAYIYAVKLLPLLASLDLTLQQRQDVLQHSQALLRDAAKCAITSDQYEVAVMLLSNGRSVFWSQALQLRTPVEELALTHPILAEKLSRLSRQLELSSYSVDRPILRLSTGVTSFPNERAYPSSSTLADERRQTIEEIRKIPGFEEFLEPPSFALLESAAGSCPIILLNASALGCDALIMNGRGSVQHIPLNDIESSWIESLRMGLHTFIGTGVTAMDVLQDTADTFRALVGRDMIRSCTDFENENLVRYVLQYLWTGVVQPVIEALGYTKSDSPKRIWWCPTGPFSSLPLHAAGIYSDDNVPVDCIFHYAVSSYCTSPQDLLHPEPEITNDFKMTAIFEPAVSGASILPATLKEMEVIERQVPDHQEHLITHLGSKENLTLVDNILHDIRRSSLTHFGCHGMQNTDDPLESYLLLSGGKVTMSKIIKDCQVPEGALAYLSACETAKGDRSRPDESLNLVATMMFAGFRSVVGTMWNIYDDDAPVVANAFYAHLFRNGNPDIRDAAYGLHLATKELREQGKPFCRWVPYVHYGI